MSKANYIIICDGRINVLSTNDPVEKIRYASDCAARLVSHVELVGTLSEPDAEVISNLQHAMMDALPSIKKPEVDVMVADMFKLLDALEDKSAQTL